MIYFEILSKGKNPQQYTWEVDFDNKELEDYNIDDE
jgi:hypothetical protein